MRAGILLLFVLFGLVLLNAHQVRNPGVALYEQGKFEEARAWFEQRIHTTPSDPGNRFWLGYTYLALGRKDRAAEEFEAYLTSDPGNEDVLYALARTYAQLAEMSLQEIFRIDPASARSYQMRGIRFELESAWKEAIQAYEKAAALAPRLSGIYSSIERIYAKELNDATNAAKAREKEAERPKSSPLPLDTLLEMRRAQPESTDVYFQIGEAFTDLKVKTIQRLKGVNPRSYRLHQLLAESYASAHKRSEAIEEYRLVLKANPSIPGVRYELARLISDTDIDAAVVLLEEELAADPAHYLAQSLLGRIHVALSNADKAIPLLQAALSARPQLMEARKALGQAFLQKKQFEAALSEFNQVDPDEEQIHFFRGQALQGLGRLDEAARARSLHQESLRRLNAPDQ